MLSLQANFGAMCAYVILDRPARSNDNDHSVNTEGNASQSAEGSATSGATVKYPGEANVSSDYQKPRTKEQEIEEREEEARANPSAKRKTRTGVEF